MDLAKHDIGPGRVVNLVFLAAGATVFWWVFRRAGRCCSSQIRSAKLFHEAQLRRRDRRAAMARQPARPCRSIVQVRPIIIHVWGEAERNLSGIKSWSLTSLQHRLMKTGGRLVKHARYYWLLLAEGHLNRRLFGDMLRRIWALPVPGG